MKALIALAAAALLLTGCSARPVAPNSDIASLTFHQYQAIENFDDSEYTQDDPTEVARFVSLLDEFGVVPGVTVTADQDECAGGLSSTVRVSVSLKLSRVSRGSPAIRCRPVLKPCALMDFIAWMVAAASWPRPA